MVLAAPVAPTTQSDSPDEALPAAVVAELQRKLAQAEQLSGHQALELDFSRKTLSRVNALRRTPASGAPASTAKSAPMSSGKARTD